MAEGQQHPLERRTHALAGRLQQRVSMMANLMRPDGRALYHERKTEAEAMTFWRKHRFDELGQSVMSTWTPDQIMALDQRLMREDDGSALG